MKPFNTVEIIGRRRYDTGTAMVVASDAYWDGHNWERRGRNTYLFRTPKGAFFAQHLTQWEGERDSLEPLTRDEALSLWERLPEHEMEFEDTFPGVTVTEA